MRELSAELSTAAKYLAVAVLGLLVLSPCIAIVWKGTNMRRGLWRAGCWRWVICCDRVYGERVSRADLLERGHGAQTVEAYYQLMFAERERASPALRLATWRENLRRHANPGLSTRLQQLQMTDDQMKRDEPIVVPQRVEDADGTAVAKQRAVDNPAIVASPELSSEPQRDPRNEAGEPDANKPTAAEERV